MEIKKVDVLLRWSLEAFCFCFSVYFQSTLQLGGDIQIHGKLKARQSPEFIKPLGLRNGENYINLLDRYFRHFHNSRSHHRIIPTIQLSRKHHEHKQHHSTCVHQYRKFFLDTAALQPNIQSAPPKILIESSPGHSSVAKKPPNHVL